MGLARHATGIGLMGFCCFAATGCDPGASQQVRLLRPSDPELSQFKWMVGSWAGGDKKVLREEHWTAPAGGSMLGMSRTVLGGKTVSYEYLRIERGADGIVFVAKPSDREGPVRFRLLDVAEKRVVFENLANDYPQRVFYWLSKDGSLFARLEGLVKGKLKARNYQWRRARITTGP